jgi:hypothetical protein
MARVDVFLGGMLTGGAIFITGFYLYMLWSGQ